MKSREILPVKLGSESPASEESTSPRASLLIDGLLAFALMYRKECLIGVGCFIAAGALVIGVAGSGPTYRDFLKTEEAFAKWEASPADLQLFTELSDSLKKTPSLLEKYDAKIAQKLIGAHLPEKALPHARRSIGRLERESPLYSAFAETSLLIEQKAYQEALQRAIGLKEQMGDEDSILAAHNLLRIASLQKELQNGPGEIAAWDDFEQFMGWKGGTADGALSQMLLESYKDQDIGLIEYIAERKSLIGR